jgi:hypothetical protein
MRAPLTEALRKQIGRKLDRSKISAHKVLTVIGSAVRWAAHSDGLRSV